MLWDVVVLRRSLKAFINVISGMVITRENCIIRLHGGDESINLRRAEDVTPLTKNYAHLSSYPIS